MKQKILTISILILSLNWGGKRSRERFSHPNVRKGIRKLHYSSEFK